MPKFYAQLNSDRVVIAVSQLHDEVNNAHLISVNKLDHALLGKQWDPKAKIFVEYTPNISPEEELQQSRRYFLQQIQEAQLLGETEEVTRLQQEWLVKKEAFKKQ